MPRVLSLAALCICFAASLALAQDGVPTLQDGFAKLGSGDNAGAAEIFTAITEADPTNARAWSLLGYARMQLQEYDAARAAYLVAVEDETAGPRAMFNLGVVCAIQRDNDGAFEWLLKARETGQVSLTDIGLNPQAAGLKSDPRYRTLYPTREEYADPFVEEVTILHDWHGEAVGDQYGWIARNIGDVTGDGVDDVVTSAPTWHEARGKIYVYSGAGGALLWTAQGNPGDQLGMGVEAAGDVNADGIPDVVAGGPNGNMARVWSGRTGALIHDLKGPVEGEGFGNDVTDPGDVNGDGHADLLIGASLNDERGEDAGAAYLISGKTGKVLHAWHGERAGDNFGSVGAGRATANGRLLLIGAPNAGPNNGGRAYVYNRVSDTPAFVIEADETGGHLGGMFASVIGDVDGDGALDVYVSDWANNAKGNSTGRIFVHSGATGKRLLVLTGEAAGDGFGIGPADAGDVNGDGHADLVVGAWQQATAAPSGGKVYVYSGKDGELMSTYTCRVPGETFGFDATGMGDVDGDGTIDYLLTSAWSAINGSRSGRVLLVSGKVE